MKTLTSALTTLSLLVCLGSTGSAEGKKYRSYIIQKGDTPVEIANKFNITVADLYRRNRIDPGDPIREGTSLKIPFPGQMSGKKYLVKPGDSVASIADFYGVSQNDLRETNGLKSDDFIQPGQKLAIPASLRGGALKRHIIRKGDTLASIAKKHRIPTKTLASANKLTKSSPLELGRTLIIPDRDDDIPANFRPKKISKLVKSGTKVNGGVEHTVQPGQSLWIIARAYNTSGEKIAAANQFGPGEQISVGQTILIPGASTVVPVRVKGFIAQPVHFVSVWNNDSATIRLLSNKGKYLKNSRRILSRLARAKTKRKRIKLLHPRLMHMLQRVAERFPGKTIEIISGYRVHKRGTRVSKHSQGRALDFRVVGVSNRELYEFIRNLPGVGAGYYPNSVFVHMDVRHQKILWTDYSGQGEPAQYDRPGKVNAEAESDAISAEADINQAGKSSTFATNNPDNAENKETQTKKTDGLTQGL